MDHTKTMENIATYKEIVEVLKNCNVRYSLLRDKNPDDPALDELDVLIWPESKDEFEQLVQQNGFALRNDAPSKAVFGKFDNGKLLLLDVHYALIQNGINYLPLDGIYERLEHSAQGYHLLSPEDELLHLFYHNLIGKKCLQVKHLSMVEKCLAEPLDQHYLRKSMGNPVVQSVFEKFCADPAAFCNDLAFANSQSQMIADALKKDGQSQNHSTIPSSGKQKRGVHIAFMGVDGAGKSTTVEHVQRLLDEAGKIKYQFVYMGPWGFVRSPLLKKVYEWKLFPPKDDWFDLIRQKLSGKKVSHSLLPMVAKWLSGTLKGFIYYFAVYVEMWYRYLREVKPNVARGRIVLSDRYVYDLRYIYKKRPINQFRTWRWFVCKFFPQPDRVVFIWNNADDIISRKPQLGAEEINEFQAYYRKVLANIPTIEKQSNRAPEEIAAEIVEEIMKIYLSQ